MTEKCKALLQSRGDQAMNPSSYTENTTVQKITAKYPEQQLDWEAIYAYNNEDFEPDSLLRPMNGEVAA